MRRPSPYVRLNSVVNGLLPAGTALESGKLLAADSFITPKNSTYVSGFVQSSVDFTVVSSLHTLSVVI